MKSFNSENSKLAAGRSAGPALTHLVRFCTDINTPQVSSTPPPALPPLPSAHPLTRLESLLVLEYRERQHVSLPGD